MSYFFCFTLLNIKTTIMETEKKELKVRRIKPHTAKWEKLANELARTWRIIRPCRHCGYPILDGYCCDTCGSDNP